VKVFTRRRRSEAATILLRYRQQIVDGTREARVPAAEPVDVPSIEVLHRLAQQAERPIRHVPDRLPGRDEFHVDDFGVRYRYLADGESPAPT
jgi:hypothetical protein